MFVHVWAHAYMCGGTGQPPVSLLRHCPPFAGDKILSLGQTLGKQALLIGHEAPGLYLSLPRISPSPDLQVHAQLSV